MNEGPLNCGNRCGSHRGFHQEDTQQNLYPGGLEGAFPTPLLAEGTLCVSTQKVTGPMREPLPEGSEDHVTISPVWGDIPY